MSIVSSYTQADTHLQADSRRYVTHYFTDHKGGVSKRGSMKVAGSDTETEYAVLRTSLEQSILNQLAEQEIQAALSRIESGLPVNVPDHQAQADFDRRVLGRMMLLDSYPFYQGYTLYQRVRGEGNTTAQRATYLGITNDQWLEIETRFSTIEAWDIELEKVQQWVELPESFN